MFSDKAKLGLLTALIMGCVLALLTSNTFLTGEKGVVARNPPLNQFCKIPRLDAQACLKGAMIGDDGSTTKKTNKKQHDDREDEIGGENTIADNSSLCATKLSQATKCERAVTRAYRHIHTSGCVRELQAATVCTLEWCDENVLRASRNEKKARRDCEKECVPVKEALTSCERDSVDTFMRQAGLNSDGTINTFR